MSKFRLSATQILLLAWLLFIFILCIIPTDRLPKVSWDLLEPDKFVHATLFIVYGYLAIRAYSPQFRQQTLRTACYIVIFALLYSFFLETYQQYCTANRRFEIPDIIANTLGAIIAIVIGSQAIKHSNNSSAPS